MLSTRFRLMAICSFEPYLGGASMLIYFLILLATSLNRSGFDFVPFSRRFDLARTISCTESIFADFSKYSNARKNSSAGRDTPVIQYTFSCIFSQNFNFSSIDSMLIYFKTPGGATPAPAAICCRCVAPNGADSSGCRLGMSLFFFLKVTGYSANDPADK